MCESMCVSVREKEGESGYVCAKMCERVREHKYEKGNPY